MTTPTSAVPLLLSARQVANALGISHRTVLKWAAGDAKAPPGFPPPRQLGGKLLKCHAESISRFVDALTPVGPLAAIGGDENTNDVDLNATPVPPAKRGRGRPRKSAGVAT